MEQVQELQFVHTLSTPGGGVVGCLWSLYCTLNVRSIILFFVTLIVTDNDVMKDKSNTRDQF